MPDMSDGELSFTELLSFLSFTELLSFIQDTLKELDEAEREALIKLAINGFIDGDAESHALLKLSYDLELIHKEALDYSKQYADDLITRGGSWCSIPVLDDEGNILDVKREFLPWAEEYSAAQRQLISDTIASGIADGRPYKEIAKDLDSIFDARDKRAELLVRTETRKHHIEGMKTRYKANNIESVEWSTAGSDVCPLCVQLEGKRYPVDDAPGGGPPLHVNCRCRLIPVVDLEEEIQMLDAEN